LRLVFVKKYFNIQFFFFCCIIGGIEAVLVGYQRRPRRRSLFLFITLFALALYLTSFFSLFPSFDFLRLCFSGARVANIDIDMFTLGRCPK
jgi:hypothetical protein